MCILSSLACGAPEKPPLAQSLAKFDPELAEVCLTEDKPLERVCDKEVDDLGRVRWDLPFGKSSEFRRAKRLFDADPKEPQLIPILGALIRKAESTNCSGHGCGKYVRHVACEAQVARIYRAKAHFKQGNLTDAFRDLASIVQSGPEHAFYEQIPEFFKELGKKGFSKPMLSVCIAVYDWPDHQKIKGRDRHWKPYTKDDPAPEW